MTINIKDYVIAKEGQAKPFLMQVQEIGKKVIMGNLEKERHLNPRVVEIPIRDVVVNLGQEPAPGKVYDVDVANIYRKSINHEGWGTIHFFIKPDPVTLKVLRRSLDRVYALIEKQGLQGYTDKIHTEIRAKKGKYAGMYVHGKERCYVWYAPECAQNSPEAMNSIVAHEFGHVLRYHGLTSKKARAKWVRIHQESIKQTVVNPKDARALWKELANIAHADADAPFSEALKSAADDEEKAEWVKTILKWFKQVHHLSPRELSILWDAGELDVIERSWPTSSIDSSRLAPMISEYATKNPEETWAEAYCMYTLGKKLPASVTSAMEKSLSLIKRSGNDQE